MKNKFNTVPGINLTNNVHNMTDKREATTRCYSPNRQINQIRGQDDIVSPQTKQQSIKFQSESQ